ncbi:hypothetical protein MKW98_007991 [Papaver atlanticum]|uniref:Uncharacterized protein n=1 Tax=Papaver atlanticum TaxID=357466 RepID=A0AAD4S605_9MAGN|nr:hypothetical protein MKW98_007991 [Papaver atlanticum]
MEVVFCVKKCGISFKFTLEHAKNQSAMCRVNSRDGEDQTTSHSHRGSGGPNGSPIQRKRRRPVSDLQLIWGIDLQLIVDRCKDVGIWHMRRPAKDFDPDSLRSGLPKAVWSLEWAVEEGKGRVYVHCTAGFGRAPAVAIAYMFWFCDMNLNSAYETLTSVRPCGPNKKAIRAATYDLAKNDPWKEPFENLPEHAFEDIAPWERKLIQDRVRALLAPEK